MTSNPLGFPLSTAAMLAVLVRFVVAYFSSYSGQGTPPMFGDFEAQRHWLEITTALPPTQWYENSTANDLLYWGLDYPPLTAYHSWALGKLGHLLVPECFALGTSRGHESLECMSFMRATVILSDFFVYFPGALCAVWGFSSTRELVPVRGVTLLLLWMLPPLLLIDHGHFQYNGVCFGLCLAAAGCVARGKLVLGGILFTAGFLFKQIALYYAFAFALAMLAFCLRESSGAASAIVRTMLSGAAVLLGCILTFAAAFAPWLLADQPRAAVGQVLHRMFPFARGLYEDKVANVWCSLSVVVKLQRLLPHERIPLFCAAVTLAALLPACLGQCLRPLHPRTSSNSFAARFAAALVAASLAFFLFAFQVHEKGILFPCVAAALLPLAMGPERRPSWSFAVLLHFQLMATFSMYPLVVKDGNELVYKAMVVILMLGTEAAPAPVLLRWSMRASFFAGAVIQAVHDTITPPSRYPDIWTLLITGTSCAYFLVCLAAVTAGQLLGYFDATDIDTSDGASKKTD